MNEQNTAARPHFGMIYGYVNAPLEGEKTRDDVEAALIAIPPEPTTVSAWADLPDCISMLLDRLTAHKLTPHQAAALLLRVFGVG